MLLLGAVLLLVATIGIARSFPEEGAAAWARVALVANIVATAVAVTTFLIDGAVVKEIAELWQAQPEDPATLGAARLATEVGFILVAGLQILTGVVALLFGCAGLASKAHPRWMAWLAVGAGFTYVVPGSAHYLLGTSTWSANLIYVSTALWAVWVFGMSWRLLRHVAMGEPIREPIPTQA